MGRDASTLLTPTIIVAERGQKWLAAVRTCVRRSATTPVKPRWVHVPRTADVPTILNKVAAGFAAVEVTRQSAGDVVLQIAQWQERFPNCCVVAALERQAVPAERHKIEIALREAGAAHVIRSPRRVAELLPLLVRHTSAVAANRADRPNQAMWMKGLGAAWVVPPVDVPACWSPLQ